MNPLHTTGLLAGLTLALLAGCGKASETAVEKLIESQAAQDGVQAKVDLQDGQTRISTTNAQGQTSEMQAGGASVSAADLGVAIYPGATIDPDTTSRISTPEATMATAQLNSADPVEKVAAFYREQLKARSAGQQFMDASTADGGATFMLGDEAGKSGVQVIVSKQDSGSQVQITSSKSKP